MLEPDGQKRPLFHVIFVLILRLSYLCINFLIFVGDTALGSFAFIFISLKQIITLILRTLKKIISISKQLYPFYSGLQHEGLLKRTSAWCNRSIRGIYTKLNRSCRSLLGQGGKEIKTLIDWRPSLPKPSQFSLKALYFFWGVLFASLMFLFFQGVYFVNSLPNPALIGQVNYDVSTQILDREGRLLYEIYRDKNRIPVTLKDMPAHVIEATIATEDRDFYKHNGVSLYGGIIRAIKEMILTRSLQGGSTITQQLVKTALLTQERTIERKFKEIILALWTERKFSKNQILEMYLNQIPYGGTAYGIEQAARRYFNKGVSDLTLSEAATLAGLPKAPSLYSPFSDPVSALNRRNQVLREMFEAGFISKEEYKKAVYEPLSVLPVMSSIKAPHFVFYVKNYLEQQYGTYKVETGGLRVRTSLDLEVQQEVEKILTEELAKIKHLNVNNGAVLVTHPSTGEILAMVGSKDYFEQPFGAYNVTVANRQPGSAVKPLMYSLALTKGYTAASIIDDSPVVFTAPGTKPYRPVNYDGRFHGKVTVRLALANSYNVPAVKILYTLGVENFRIHAQKLGVTSWVIPQRYGLSLTLGGGEVKMVDMATAYGVFANGGDRVDLHPILEVRDFKGQVLYKPSTLPKTPVLSSAVSFIISDILSDSNARRWAFGDSPQLKVKGRKVAVKTGTTNEMRDNWTIGYTPKFLVVSWVGNNDNSPMDSRLTSGITGAAPIWQRVISFVLERDFKTAFSDTASDVTNDFSVPDTVISKPCYFGHIEYFEKGTEEKASCRGVAAALPLASPVPTQ